MKISSGFNVLVLALMTLVLVAEATFDLDTLLGIEEPYDDDFDRDFGDGWDDIQYKRGVGTQKFIACFHPLLRTKCFCDVTKPKFSRKYFYYCRGARRHSELRPV
ncbi:uncharacterized protein [Diadema antillarum]|uniref:uncharacterized protein n=1 Tax=Diadema antillarum TaxID=105358 RepID=UPI003A879A01